MESQQFRDYFKTYRLDALYLLFFEIIEFYDLNKHYSNRLKMLDIVVDKYLDFATSLGMDVSPEELEQVIQCFKDRRNLFDLHHKIKKLYLAQGMMRYAESIDEYCLRAMINTHCLRSEEENIADMHILIENYIKKCAPCDEEHIVSFALEVLFSDEFTHFLAVNNKNINARNVIRNLLQKKDFLASCSARQRSSILVTLIENSEWDGVRLFLQDFPDTPLVVDNKNAILLAIQNNADVEMFRMLFAAPDLIEALQFKINSDKDLLSFLLNDNVFIEHLIPTPPIEQLPVPLLERIYVRLLEKDEEKVAEHLIAQRKDLYVSGVYLGLVPPLLEQKKYEFVRRLNSRDENASILELFTANDGLLQHVEPMLDSPLIKEEFTVAQVTRAFQNLLHFKESNLALKLLALRPEIAEAKFSTSLRTHGSNPSFSTLDWMTADDKILDFLLKHPAIINQFSPQQIVHTVCYLIMDKEFIAAKRLIEVAKEIDINALIRGFCAHHFAVAAKELSLDQEKERHDLIRFMCEDLKPSAAVDLESDERNSSLDIALESDNFQAAQYFIETPSLLAQFSGEQLGRTLKKLREVNLEELAVHVLKNRPDTEVGTLFYDVIAEVPPCLEIIKILSKRKELLAVHADNEKTPLGCALESKIPNIPVIMTLVNAQLQLGMFDDCCEQGVTNVLTHFKAKEIFIEDQEILTMTLNCCRLRAKHAESKAGFMHSRTYMRQQGDDGFHVVRILLERTKSVEEFDALVSHLQQHESQHPFLKTFLFSYTTSVFAPANSWGNLMKFIEAQRKVIAEKAEAKL